MNPLLPDDCGLSLNAGLGLTGVSADVQVDEAEVPAELIDDVFEQLFGTGKTTLTELVAVDNSVGDRYKSVSPSDIIMSTSPSSSSESDI
jgi:hypothetical protein